MARIEDVKREKLSPRQQQLHDDFLKSRPRNTLTGPFAVLIHTPDIAEPADRLVNYYRQNSETRPPSHRADHFAARAQRHRAVRLVGA